MPDQKISDLGDGGAPQATDQFVIARGTTNNKLAWSSLQAAATSGNIAVTAAGNTAGALALISSGTLTLAGGNNITVSQAGNAITLSGANVGGAQTAISGVAASNTTYTSGTVTFTGVGGGVTVSSNTGQRVDISVAAPVAQTVQTQNVHNVTLSGNTAGVMAQVSSGTLTLAGGNNITVSQNGNAVTISGANVGGAQTGISGIAASNTTYTSGSVTITGVGGGITVSSNTGQRIDLSVAAQSVQPETQTFVAGIQNSQTTYTSGTVNLSVVAGNLTIRSTTGQAFQFSMSQTVQPETQTAISGIANSQTTYTSGTVSLSELGAITIRSTTGNQFQFSVNAQTTQTQGILSAGVSTGGNTAGNTTVNTGSRFVLVASGNATASQATAAGASTVTISVGTQTVQTQGILSAGVSTGGNTAGNTQVSTGSRLVFVGSNNITLSQGTAAGATTITISGPSGGVETQTAISGIANSQTTYTSGTVSLSELGAITIRSTTGNQFQFSVNAQTTQTQGILSAGVSTGGNTAGNTTVNTGSRLVIVGSNGITASQGTAAGATTITLSGATQTVQTQGVLSVGASTGGNTAGNTTVNTGSRLVFVGTNNITVSQGTAAGATTLTLSGPTTAAQSVQTQGILNVALSNVGNTAGDTGINSGTRYVLAGGNNITLSGSSAANATTVTISAASQSVQTQGILSAGVSNVGNTSGNTTVNTGSRLVLAGGNNITLSQSTAAGATTITVSAPNLGAGAMSVGASNLGNTAGDTGITGTRLILVGSDNITLSQATDANGGTVSFVGGGGGGFSAGMSNLGNTAGNTGVTGTRLFWWEPVRSPSPRPQEQRARLSRSMLRPPVRSRLPGTSRSRPTAPLSR